MFIIVLSLDCLTVKKLTDERHLILRVNKYFKGISTSKFGTKDKLYYKGGFAFVSIEEKKL